MFHQHIYKLDLAGRLRVWQVEQNGLRYCTHAGLAAGTIVVSAWTHCAGNQQRPDPVEQCSFEIAALYQYKLSRTYHLTVADAEKGAHHFEPMLAQPLDRARLPTLDLPVFGAQMAPRLYVQPKLDGMRCIITADGMFTRQGKPIVSAPHIMEALKDYFALCPDAVLDGELYSDMLSDNFQKIMSLARKTKPTEADLRESKCFLQFHCYDAPFIRDGYPVRSAAVNMAYLESEVSTSLSEGSPIHVVETVAIHTWEEWDALHAQWIGEGYEGSIGRVPDAPYQNRRTHDLIKRKDFQDAEFQVAKLEEGDGNWAGACKRVYCWLPKVPATERTHTNISDATTFIATPKGSHSYLHNVLFGERPDYCTVQFFGWTTTDNPKPRHPIGKQLHWGARDS